MCRPRRAPRAPDPERRCQQASPAAAVELAGRRSVMTTPNFALELPGPPRAARPSLRMRAASREVSSWHDDRVACLYGEVFLRLAPVEHFFVIERVLRLRTILVAHQEY